MQGMCDILAPILVVLEDGKLTAGTGRQAHCALFVCCQWYLAKSTISLPLLPVPLTVHAESLVYQCYVQQMERLQHHFPPNQGVSEKLANLRALVEVCALSALNVPNTLLTLSVPV